MPIVRLGDPSAPPDGDAAGTPPGFDPIWGTLGAPILDAHDSWLSPGEDVAEGLSAEVEIFGNGFEIAGQIQTGGFDRLSGRINMQSGFIQVRNAYLVHLGQGYTPDPDQRKGTLWVRLSQIVMMAERSVQQGVRPGAPIVRKQRRRVSIVTPGYQLEGDIHVHAHGSMNRFLESPDPHFLPITDLTVHWLSDPALVDRFPFALINRDQLVTVLDEAAPAVIEAEQSAALPELPAPTSAVQQAGRRSHRRGASHLKTVGTTRSRRG
jgi:hypothetical protein